ncbi:MAG: hypothetical protein VX938_05290, partial [Myxococcota bacterium]|nr:hypothetical protein [Myxococcota bacterium]
DDQDQADEESFCADIGSTGTCLGSVLYFCDNAGELQAYECGTAGGGYCTWTGPGVGYDCVEPAYARPEEAPDVLLLGVSGHMKAASDLFEDANPEYLAASGTLNAVADVYSGQGLTVHSLPYADRFYDEVLDNGEPGAYGFLSLLDDLEFAYCNWIVHCDEDGIPLGYIDNPTRVVVVAHSHGCVWAHTALWVADWAPVEALISLDAVSMGWEGKVGGFGDNWASVILDYTEETNHEWPFAIWDPTDSWSVPGLNKLQDVEDLVPANVGVNIEVRSGGVVDFGDGEVNHRGNGSQFQIYEQKFPKEKHSKVDEVDSDALSWVLGLLGVLYGL